MGNGGGKGESVNGGTNPRTLLCALQIYTTLVNGIALQEESVEWRDETPHTSLCIANLHHTRQWHSSSGGKMGTVGERGTNSRAPLYTLQIYTTLGNGIALQEESVEWRDGTHAHFFIHCESTPH